jgi:hypothetical protein
MRTSTQAGEGLVSQLHLIVSTPHLDPPDTVAGEVTSPEHTGARDPILSGAENLAFRVTTARRWPAQSVGVDFSPEAPKELVDHAFDLRPRCLWSFERCRSWNQLLPAIEGPLHSNLAHRRVQKNLVTPSSSTTTRSLIPAERASCSSSSNGSSTGSCDRRKVP